MFSWVDPYVFFSTAFSTHSTLLYSLYSTLRFKVCVSSGAWAPPGIDVELPPDVASGGESGVDVESDVDLPPARSLFEFTITNAFWCDCCELVALMPSTNVGPLCWVVPSPAAMSWRARVR